MKQSTNNTISYFSMDEIDVSAILLELPHLIFKSESRPRFSFTWGAKRRRSANDETTSRSRVKLSSSPASQPSLHGIFVGPTVDNHGPTKKVGAASPATPLSFSPSETDGKSKHSKRKVSLKRKREEWLQIIDKLTKHKGFLNGEIENAKHYHNKLKAYNLELKARKQELTLGLKRENPHLEISISQPTVNPLLNIGNQDHQQKIHSMVHQQPLIIDQAVHKLETRENSRRHPYFQMLSLGMVNDDVGPLGIPDLNVCPEESFGMQFAQPCDLQMVNKCLSKAMAAQARQKRIQICRLKNSTATSKLRYPFR